MMSSSKKQNKYEKMAKLFQAVANPVRLHILDILIANSCFAAEKGSCVGEINKKIDLPQPYISKHLKVLKDCGILTYRREANRIIYSFEQNDTLNELFEYLHEMWNSYTQCK